MDYKLQWKIERKIGSPYIPSTSGIRLSPYPAIDYVNPGCDGKLYQFYVPIHAQSSIHIINKKVETVGLAVENKLIDNDGKIHPLRTIVISPTLDANLVFNDLSSLAKEDKHDKYSDELLQSIIDEIKASQQKVLKAFRDYSVTFLPSY